MKDAFCSALIHQQRQCHGDYWKAWLFQGVHGGTVGWGTALQVRRSRVRSLMVSLEFFIDIILPAALWPWGWLSLWQKWVLGIFPGGKGRRQLVRRADNLTTFIWRLSWNLGASTSWNPQGLSRLVMGLLAPPPNTHTHTHTLICCHECWQTATHKEAMKTDAFILPAYTVQEWELRLRDCHRGCALGSQF